MTSLAPKHSVLWLRWTWSPSVASTLVATPAWPQRTCVRWVSPSAGTKLPKKWPADLAAAWPEPAVAGRVVRPLWRTRPFSRADGPRARLYRLAREVAASRNSCWLNRTLRRKLCRNSEGTC